MIMKFLELGVDPSESHLYGTSVLLYCTSSNAAQLLVDKGADRACFEDVLTARLKTHLHESKDQKNQNT